MDGGTVNCSSNTAGAVREGNDELGGCSDIPRENNSNTLCVYIYVCMHVLFRVCEHV